MFAPATPSTSPTRRPRVLLSAYALSPEQGGESAVGWHRALQTARLCDTWVIYGKRENEPEIGRYLDQHGPISGLNFHFLPMTDREVFVGKLPGMYYLAYHHWQKRAYRAAEELHRQIGFDLAHQVNFCSYREPGYLHRLPIPFVWGPVGGTQNSPWRFLPMLCLSGLIAESTRNVLNRLQLKFARRPREAARKAVSVLAANSTAQHDLTAMRGAMPELLLETGLHAVRETPRETDIQRRELRLLWSGNLLSRKGLHLLLFALAKLPQDVSYSLRVLGQGPRRKDWLWLARKLGIEQNIHWLGWLSYREAVATNEWADAMVFSSLRDTSGNVVLEAIASGVPVIYLDHQGVHDMLNAECGIPIAVKNPQQVIDDLAAAITRLSRDREECARLGRGAWERAHKYLWSHNGDALAAIYRQALPEHLQPAPLVGEPAVENKVPCNA